MKFQSVILLTFLGVIALSFNAEGTSPASLRYQTQSTVVKQQPCISINGTCVNVHKTTKTAIPDKHLKNIVIEDNSCITINGTGKTIPAKYVALIKKYSACILENADNCDNHGRVLKEKLPEFLAGCTVQKCTGREPKFQDFIDAVMKFCPEKWQKLIQNYVNVKPKK